MYVLQRHACSGILICKIYLEFMGLLRTSSVSHSRITTLLSFGKWQAGWSAGWSAPSREDQTSSPPYTVPRATSETSKTFAPSNPARHPVVNLTLLINL